MISIIIAAMIFVYVLTKAHIDFVVFALREPAVRSQSVLERILGNVAGSERKPLTSAYPL